MNRTLATERLYFLGDFKNLKLGDTLIDIPEEWALNKELVEQLRTLQLLETEIAYRTYMEISKTQGMAYDDAMVKLAELRDETMLEVKNLLNGNTEDKETTEDGN